MKNLIKFAVISNINFEPYFKKHLQKEFLPLDIGINLRYIQLDNTCSSLNVPSLITADYIIVYIDFFCLFPNAICQSRHSKDFIENCVDYAKNRCQVLYQRIKINTGIPILWLGFENYYRQLYSIEGSVSYYTEIISHLNIHLISMLSDPDRFIDLQYIIGRIGIKDAYSSRNRYRWDSPFSEKLLFEIAHECKQQYLIDAGITKKCIVVDCDNVLWGGVLSEDGIEQIRLGKNGIGQSYADFQCLLLALYSRGVILTICSKNDFCDVIKVFREHTGMILKEEHIACFQVNWNSKVENILKIADYLNIGLDSMVFIDDSDYEVLSVCSILPDVFCIKYDRDTIYSQLSCFNLKSNVDVVRNRQRNYTYKTNEQRNKLRESCVTFSEYLYLLNMNIDIHIANSMEYSRISELTQRANKCTNGQRYTVADIQSMVLNENSHLYTVALSDRFSDLGIVGAIAIENDKLTLFCLSCRALGREVEEHMLRYILDNYHIHSIQYVSTGKNGEIEKLLQERFPCAIVTDDKSVKD